MQEKKNMFKSVILFKDRHFLKWTLDDGINVFKKEIAEM